MNGRDNSKFLKTSRLAGTDNPVQQQLPARNDRTYRKFLPPEQQSVKAEHSDRSLSRCEEFAPSVRCNLQSPIRAMVQESPFSPVASEESKYSSSDSESSSESSENEPPDKSQHNDCTSTDSSTESDSDSSSDSSDSSDSTSSGNSSSNDGSNFNAAAKIPGKSVAARPSQSKVSADSCATKGSLSSSIGPETSSGSKVFSISTDLSREPLSFSPCDIEDKAEKKQAIEQAVKVPRTGDDLFSTQGSQLSRPSANQSSLEAGAADSSTDRGMNLKIHPVLGPHCSSGEAAKVSHIQLPPTADVSSSLGTSETPRPRNLVRIVMKKSGVTRGISAKTLTKNPVINIFGEIVFDGCTFEGESRPPAERAAEVPSELDQKELEVNSKEIKSKACDDILQKGVRRETGEGKGRGGEEEVQGRRQGTGRGGEMEAETKSSLTVEKLMEERDDISKNLQLTNADKPTKEISKRLVDYDDDDVDSCHGRLNNGDENPNTSNTLALQTAKKKVLKDRACSDQRNRKSRPDRNGSYSRKRKHSQSTCSSSDERDSIDASDGVEPNFEGKHRTETRYPSTTGLKILENSDKDFSDLRCSKLLLQTTEKREHKLDDFDRSGSQPTGRNLACNTSPILKKPGTNELTDRALNSERKSKATKSETRSESIDYKSLDTEGKDFVDDEELKRRESRHSRILFQPKISTEKTFSSHRHRSSAKTYSPECYRYHSCLQRKRGNSPTRAAPSDRILESRRSETRYREAEVRGTERKRRSIEGHDNFTSGKETLEKSRRRTSSHIIVTKQTLDETRNETVSKSTRSGNRSTSNRSEQSRKTRSSTTYDDVSYRQSSRQQSSASTSFKSSPEECFRFGHGTREKTRHTETLNSSGGHRGEESGRTRSSGSGKMSSSEEGKRTGDGRAERTRNRSVIDRTDENDQSSHDNNNRDKKDYYETDWIWPSRTSSHLKGSPSVYPFPYFYPFAHGHPFAPPTPRYNSYVYANCGNEQPRRFVLNQQPPSFYLNYQRPHLPYWPSLLPQHLYPTYAPYETTAGHGEGLQYDEDEGCQDYLIPQDEFQEDQTVQIVAEYESSSLTADQELLEGASEFVAIQSSAVSLSLGFDASESAEATEDIIEEEESSSHPLSDI